MIIKIISKIGASIYCAAIIAVSILFTIKDADRNLIKEIVIESGSEIRIEDFFCECPEDARFISDVSVIDTKEPAVYKLKVAYDKVFKKEVILRIEDHTAPKGIALPKMQYAGLEWPEASECVGYLSDLSGIASIEYRDGVPDYRFTGDYMVPVVVTDWYDNSTLIEVPFHVTDDHNAPLFYGIHDITIDDSEDAVINYFDGITVKDDYDESPRYTVDTSNVVMGEEGTYVITYSAADEAGNIRRQNALVNIKSSSTVADAMNAGNSWDSPMHNDIYKAAMDLVETLRGENDTETALNIFTWVHSNISYQSVYEPLTFEDAVYEAFTKRSGDCYVSYACCKMLLDCAGIPNMTVLRYPVNYNGHFWNLVKLDGEWYHCDSTMFMKHQSLYFEMTDQQIADSRHQFNGSILPVRAGGTPKYD